jgi:cytidine deaminase
VIDPLLEPARAAQARAYAPYSGFRVGASLEAVDGRVFGGCNVENASYGLTICAERAALVQAVAQGAREFRRILVVSDVDPPATPCGACRQSLAEFSPEMEVTMAGPNGSRTWKLAELLPEAFGLGGGRRPL